MSDERRAPEALDLGAREPTWFVRGTLTVGRTIYRCVTRVDMGPLEGLPADGPLILASNHMSNADPPLIASWLTPALGRSVHWMAKQEALDWPVAGAFLKANGCFGIRRGAADTEAFRLAKRVLDDGRILGTFPEGTRSPTGRLAKGKEGVTLLAIRTGAPVLPVAVWGTEKLWPRGAKLPKPGGRVHLRVGEPLVLERRTIDGKREDLQTVTDRLMVRIALLLPPAYRGVYAEAASAAEAAEAAAEGEGTGPVA